MDGSHFDTLVKALAITPLTRAMALRGLAASAVVLTGLRLAGEVGAAKKKTREKKVRVCDCPIGDPSGCQTKKVKKSQVQSWLLRHLCSYRGRCQASSLPCPVF